MEKNYLKGIAIVFVLSLAVVLSACSVQEKKIISCEKILDMDCTATECTDQCSDYASTVNKQLRSSMVVNGGQGCECYMEIA